MLSGPTVLILGAGSSVDFKMPVGEELANDIRGLVDFHLDQANPEGDEVILKQLRRRFPEAINQYVAVGQKLASVLLNFKSIDDCLYTHGDDEHLRLLGKVAIARAIALKEHSSWLRGLWLDSAQRDAALNNLRGGWAPRMIQVLATGLKDADRTKLFDNFKLITFNYDRCAETAFFQAIRETYRIGDAEAAEVMKGLKVYRPYGGLGPLPWGGRDGEPFGPEKPDLLQMADNISVYTENLGERPDLQEMRNDLSAADNIICLGFGFHPQNMKLLTSGSDHQRMVFSTYFRMPLSGHAAMVQRLKNIFGPSENVMLATPGEDCVKFLTDYAPHFSA